MSTLVDMLNYINLNSVKIFNKLEKLQINKPPCVDGIIPEILVKTSASLRVRLSIIFNYSFNSGIV